MFTKISQLSIKLIRLDKQNTVNNPYMEYINQHLYNNDRWTNLTG